jgi:RNA polymerase sigma-70 factor (ECF subfamily)
LQTWIIRIAINKARDYIIKQKAEKRGGGAKLLSINTNVQDGEITIDIADSKSKPDENILKNEEYQILFEALEKLGNPCKEVIELRYFAELSYDKIAHTTNINPKTVGSRLSKCLDKLESIIKKQLNKEKIP